MEIINIRNLTKFYGKSRGVIDLNLVVKKGDIFGFMGPNGAGKSTTIRTMLGLIRPTSGQIEIFQQDTRTKNTSILKNIGYMPSEAMFYPSLKVEEIFKLSSDIHEKDCTSYRNELCDRLQVDTKKKIEELSLGNRKKVSIVCAMQHKPDLYILDEPTSGLDPLMQNEFFKLLLEQNKNGATIFLSSHILSEIQKYCNQVAIIRQGKIITIDTVANLSATNAKRIKLTALTKMPSLEGISGLNTNNGTTCFLYNGNLETLVNYLSSIQFTDLLIEEPSLDEIFMHYYEKED